MEQGKEQLLSNLGFVFHDKTGTYRKAVLIPKGENGNDAFFGLNKQEQKVFLIDTYKNYAEPIIKNIIL